MVSLSFGAMRSFDVIAFFGVDLNTNFTTHNFETFTQSFGVGFVTAPLLETIGLSGVCFVTFG